MNNLICNKSQKIRGHSSLFFKPCH